MVRNSLQRVLDAQEHSDALAPLKIENLEAGKWNSTVLLFLKIIQECHRASSQTGVKTMTRPARNRSFDEFRSQIIRMQTSFHVSYFYSVDAEFAHFKTTHNSTNTHTTCMPCLCLCEIDTQLSFTGVLKRIISLLAATNETSTAVASTAVGAEATFLFG